MLALAAAAAPLVGADIREEDGAQRNGVAARAAAQGMLTVSVEGLRSDEGKVVMALFDSERTYAKTPRVAATLSIAAGRATWVVSDLAPGRYAVALFHDANGNGKLDKGLFGRPKEDYGFSRNARGRFGPPPWAKARFDLRPGANRQAIRLGKSKTS